jgi:hypothetical protein
MSILDNVAANTRKTRRIFSMKKDFVRILTVATMVTLTATGAHAARQWQHLGSDDSNSHVMYDKKTTKRSGDIVSGWISKQYNVDEKAMKEKSLPITKYYGATWTLAFYEFDCKQNKMRVLVGKEQLGSKKVEDIPRGDWQPLQPKSLDELLLNAICKEVKQPAETTKDTK